MPFGSMLLLEEAVVEGRVVSERSSTRGERRFWVRGETMAARAESGASCAMRCEKLEARSDYIEERSAQKIASPEQQVVCGKSRVASEK